MFKLYIIGICILIIAIIANAIIVQIGIMSWYDFINLLQNSGAATFQKLNILDYIWLFIIYPLVLSFGYVLGSKCNEWFFS